MLYSHHIIKHHNGFFDSKMSGHVYNRPTCPTPKVATGIFKLNNK